MQATLWHKIFHLHLSFCIWKLWKRRKKIQAFEYLKNKKGLLNEIKTLFIVFEGLSFSEKIKIW